MFFISKKPLLEVSVKEMSAESFAVTTETVASFNPLAVTESITDPRTAPGFCACAAAVKSKNRSRKKRYISWYSLRRYSEPSKRGG